MQGLLSALVEMACGDESLGIVDLDWNKIKANYPDNKGIAKRRWDVVLKAVSQLAEETDDPSEMALRSRFTRAQCKRALEELQR